MAANIPITIFRTSVAGRQPNTVDPGNTQYISAGGLALNMPDQILYTSDGTNLIIVGSNQTNIDINGTINVNNSVGINGQVLYSNGTGAYWGNAPTGSGSSTVNTRITTTNDVILSTDYLLEINTTSNIIINLPLASSVAGQIFMIKNKSNYSVNVIANTTDLIDGNSYLIIRFNNSTLEILSDGTSWSLI